MRLVPRGRRLARLVLVLEGWRKGNVVAGDHLRAIAPSTRIRTIAGDVTDGAHREALAAAARELGGLDLVINNAGTLGPSPQPGLLDYPLDVLEAVYRVNVVAPIGILQSVHASLKPGATIINITSDAAVEAYEGWGGYGSSKAALEQISRVLAAENPTLNVYWVDPGDMRTDMHQAAFPGEDISDREPPEASVPGIVALATGDRASGRFRARSVLAVESGGVS